MGSKGGGTQAAPPVMQDNSAAIQQQEQMMQMMMGMMEGFMAQSAGMMESMQMPEMPEATLPERTPVIDWTEKQDQLNAKMKADYDTDRARQKGRSDTVLTSPLLDDEEPEITDSILASGN